MGHKVTRTTSAWGIPRLDRQVVRRQGVHDLLQEDIAIRA